MAAGLTVGIMSDLLRSATEFVLQQNEKSEIHDFFELPLVIHENDLLMMFMNVEVHEDMKRNVNTMKNETITIHQDFNENQNQEEKDIQLLQWIENERGKETSPRLEELVADQHF